jgi:hypothetical protein
MKQQVRDIEQHVLAVIGSAPARTAPFYHLVLDKVFPAELYRAMLENMPPASACRALRGRGNVNLRPDGTPTRVKLDLLPEFVRRLPPAQRAVWSAVGRVLRSAEVRHALVARLAPGLERRFGAGFGSVGLHAIPTLTRDTSGYRIREHTDTRWKAITVQVFLPPDDRMNDVGTVFSERLPDGAFRRVTQMPFVPNHGYAFAVGSDTWHSVDPVENRALSRDSILHTYFVNQGVLQVLRNQGKRVGNLLLNEARHLAGRQG